MKSATLNIEDDAAVTDVAILRLSGCINFQTYEKLNRKINEKFNARHYKIVVDLAGVEYVCSVGVGSLLTAALTANEHAGGALVILNPRPTVNSVFNLIGFFELSHAFKDLPSALEFCRNAS